MAKRVATDADEELREQLDRLDEKVLKYLLSEKWQVTLTESDDKKKLIERVLEDSNRRPELPGIIRQVLHLELLHAAHQVGADTYGRIAALESRLDERLGDHDARLTVLGSHIKEDVDRLTARSDVAVREAKEELSSDIEAVKGDLSALRQEVAVVKTNVDFVRTIYAPIAGLIGLITVAGAATGVKGCRDAEQAQSAFRQQESRLKELGENYQNKFEAYQIALDIQRSDQIFRLLDSVREVMSDFSSTLPPLADLERVGEHLEPVQKLERQLQAELQPATASNAPAAAAPVAAPVVGVEQDARTRKDDLAVLKLMGQIRNALAETSKLKTDPPPTPNKRAVLVDAAIAAWDVLEVPIVSAARARRYDDFFDEAREYRINAVGVLRIAKYPPGSPAERQEIEAALAAFKAVTENEERVHYPRLYLNYALAIEKKVGHLGARYEETKDPVKREEVWARMKDLLEQEDAQLTRAYKTNEPGRYLSNVQNNRACHSLLTAQWLHRRGEKERAAELLEQARSHIRPATATQTVPASFFTRAEIECVAIQLGYVQVTEANREELKARVFHDLRIAGQNHHFDGRVTGRDHMLAKYPHLAALEHLAGQTWKEDLFRATEVGQPPSQPAGVDGATPI